MKLIMGAYVAALAGTLALALAALDWARRRENLSWTELLDRLPG